MSRQTKTMTIQNRFSSSVNEATGRCDPVETVAQQRNYGKMNDSLQAPSRDRDRNGEDGGMSTGAREALGTGDTRTEERT
jgi:hypothetical protein